MERYSSLALSGKRLLPSLFTKERFLSYHPSDTFYGQSEFDKFHAGIRGKFDDAVYVGDKIPYLYRTFKRLFASAPAPFVVFLLRELQSVAESYNERARNPKDVYWSRKTDAFAAIRDWNESLRCAVRMTTSPLRSQFIILRFESFLASTNAMAGLLDRLGLAVQEPMVQTMRRIACEWDRLRSRPRLNCKLTRRQQRAVERRGDMSRYSALLDYAESTQTGT
jgi:hypothetical protein